MAKKLLKDRDVEKSNFAKKIGRENLAYRKKNVGAMSKVGSHVSEVSKSVKAEN